MSSESNEKHQISEDHPKVLMLGLGVEKRPKTPLKIPEGKSTKKKKVHKITGHTLNELRDLRLDAFKTLEGLDWDKFPYPQDHPERSKIEDYIAQLDAQIKKLVDARVEKMRRSER